ncbi:alpha-1,2-mannosyltransferase ALG9 [Hyposmocoma kahamanoa]|uniref:alpha-1,2-mannosyltransferase ALG9 n=1 Tax=Hyposmocoma kahamanoa TaxID=1477025 RepID=UPI000E6D66F2|nr:alpha-1,2-mannosyltransferase ALG9 [Hyposmocoma kahamanoa]
MPLTARQRSIHNKNGAKRTTSFKGKRLRKGSEGEYIVTSAPTDLQSLAYPGGAVALALLLVARLASAYWGHISDCDETFNYWEPLHYLVYGTGLQTWEYSPVYAIRSYMPLWLFAVPAKMLSFIFSPVTVFYSLRFLLAVLSACAELIFYKAVCHEFGVHVGRIWLGLTLLAAGSFVASSAMLPSSWSLALVSAALASWWRNRYPAAVLFTAANALLSWPFTALIGLPIAVDMLILKRQFVEFFKWSLISLIIILLPTIAVDSYHYGRLVIAPWNIIAYNIFTEHGPDLYGVEPWTYYFINGFLNFNFVWVLALCCPVHLMVCRALAPRSTLRATFCKPYWLTLLPLDLWLAVFMLQPHKEERFLYPVYSMIVLGGAIGLDCMQKMMFWLGTEVFRWQKDRRHYLASEYAGQVMILAACGIGIIGISRTVALYNNYHGPMTILNHLPPTSEPLNICYGKDWYRYPSSFHIPRGSNIRFIRSDFKGQLPAPYSSEKNATRLIHPYFNDQNKMDRRTLLHPSECHYLVDSDIGEPTILQPAYHKDNNWEIVASVPFIDAKKSHSIFRAFYIPMVSSKHCVFANLYLLKNKILLG